ncbi:hypothetical protein G6M16_008880 [Agrobacterium tumefaciens]|nr:hypothetical protein G6M16_008880 [Agrobacterium tumefaciens]
MVDPYAEHMKGARMARRLAAEYRADADKPDTPDHLRTKWLSEADKCDERADWYETRAAWYAPPAEMEAAA